MNVLVVYATRHGATAGIAERIASTLAANDLDVTFRTAAGVDRDSLDGFDAFVIGGAAYMGHWLNEVTAFVRSNLEALGSRPVYLFSSGPVGTATVDAKGRDLIEASRPAEFAEFETSLRPRDERVFFGAFDATRKPVGLVERIGAPFLRLPQVREVLKPGDFRDWPAIEAWARGVALDLTGSAPWVN